MAELETEVQLLKRDIEDVKSINYARERFPGFGIRNLIEGNKEYINLLEKTGGVDKFLQSMGYELRGIDLKIWKDYKAAKEQLDNLVTKEVEPIQFPGGYKGQKGKYKNRAD